MIVITVKFSIGLQGFPTQLIIPALYQSREILTGQPGSSITHR